MIAGIVPIPKKGIKNANKAKLGIVCKIAAKPMIGSETRLYLVNIIPSGTAIAIAIIRDSNEICRCSQIVFNNISCLSLKTAMKFFIDEQLLFLYQFYLEGKRQCLDMLKHQLVFHFSKQAIYVDHFLSISLLFYLRTYHMVGRIFDIIFTFSTSIIYFLFSFIY